MYRCFADLRALGRVDEYPRHAPSCSRGRIGWLLPRYTWHPASEVSNIFLGKICAGSTFAWSSDRFPLFHSIFKRVRVHPGDLIFGDIDGVLVVPHQYESEAVHAALEKVRGE